MFLTELRELIRSVFIFSSTTTMDPFYPLILLRSECIAPVYTYTQVKKNYIHVKTNTAFSGDQQGGEVSPKSTKYHWLPIIYLTEIPEQLKNFYST